MEYDVVVDEWEDTEVAIPWYKDATHVIKKRNSLKNRYI